MTSKEFYLYTRNREFLTTIRVMEHFPVEQETFKPHERSSSAHQLFWTLVLEEKINLHVARGDIMAVNIMTEEEPPKTITDIINRYREVFLETTKELEALSDEAYESEISFFMGTMRKIDAFWITLLDSIHHRGQMSVYIRMAGGKVPSIYGPSADEQSPPAR